MQNCAAEIKDELGKKLGRMRGESFELKNFVTLYFYGYHPMTRLIQLGREAPTNWPRHQVEVGRLPPLRYVEFVFKFLMVDQWYRVEARSEPLTWCNDQAVRPYWNAFSYSQ